MSDGNEKTGKPDAETKRKKREPSARELSKHARKKYIPRKGGTTTLPKSKGAAAGAVAVTEDDAGGKSDAS